VHRALSSRVEQGLSLSYEEVMLYLDLLTDTKKHQEVHRLDIHRQRYSVH
jgi:hypothetical protein